MKQNYNQIIDQWLGNVNRWHSSPIWQLRESGDTTHAHAKRCASLYLAMWPDCSAQELAAVIAHDDGESGVGDISYIAKKQFPELRSSSDLAEANRLSDLGLHLCPNKQRLAIVDGLDALMWVNDRAPHIIDRDDFVDHAISVLDLAIKSGVGDKVRAIFIILGMTYQKKVTKNEH
jgi:hypothetical protein